MQEFMWRLTLPFFIITFICAVTSSICGTTLLSIPYWLFTGKELFAKPMDLFPDTFMEKWISKIAGKDVKL